MTACFIIHPPEVVLHMPNPQQPRVEHTCSEGLLEKIGVMIWDIGLVFVCCIYAFRTRKLPNNYKESRFITFCVFSTLLVQLAFSPTIFTTQEPFYRSVYSALSLIVIATVANLCLFVIKLYALYFVAEKDLIVSTSNDTLRSHRQNGFSQDTTHGNNSSVARQKCDLAPVLDTKLDVANQQPTRTVVGVVSALSLLDPHTPSEVAEVPNSDSKKDETPASTGDVNLGFQKDDDDEGTYDLDDDAGGVYCGPIETTT